MSANRIVLIGLTLWALKAASGGLVIDSFDDANEGSWPITATTLFESIHVLDVNLPGVLGGTRITSLFVQSLDVPGVDEVQLDIAAEDGVFDYASSVGLRGASSLVYRGESPAVGLNVELPADGIFRIDFADFDAAGALPMRVTVIVNLGRLPTPNLTRFLTKPGAQTLDFLIADFPTIDQIDLTNVRNISVEFSPSPGTDFRVNQISVVPEPTTLCLLAVGGLLATWRRRRAYLSCSALLALASPFSAQAARSHCGRNIVALS